MAVADEPNDPTSVAVRYSVKELLTDIKSSVAVIDAKLDAKADKTDVAKLAEQLEHKVDRTDVDILRFRVDGQGRRLDSLEGEHLLATKKLTEETEAHRWRVPLIFSFVSLVVSPFLWNIVNHLKL